MLCPERTPHGFVAAWGSGEANRTDVTFPSETVIRKRLGNRNEAVTRVAGHYYGKKGYEDVIAICEAVAPEPGSSASAAEPGARDGWVYLIKSGKFYKIGRAFNFERRSRSIGLQLPERGLTVHTIRTDDPVGIEAYWHQRFAAKRKGGEWFDLTARDVAAFKRRKSFM